jgi:hypothetical protein
MPPSQHHQLTQEQLESSEELKRKNQPTPTKAESESTKPRKRRKQTDVFEMMASALPSPAALSATSGSSNLLAPTIAEGTSYSSSPFLLMR